MASPTGEAATNLSEQFVPIAQRLALTIAQCCALTGLRDYQIRDAIHSGELAYIQNGTRGTIIVRREALERFLKAKEQRDGRA